MQFFCRFSLNLLFYVNVHYYASIDTAYSLSCVSGTFTVSVLDVGNLMYVCT